MGTKYFCGVCGAVIPPDRLFCPNFCPCPLPKAQSKTSKEEDKMEPNKTEAPQIFKIVVSLYPKAQRVLITTVMIADNLATAIARLSSETDRYPCTGANYIVTVLGTAVGDYTCEFVTYEVKITEN
jgi:hypothetical protein